MKSISKYGKLACIYILTMFLMSGICSAQVIGNGTPEQRKTGVYKSITIITEPGRPTIILPPPKTESDGVKVSVCVETDKGCEETRHFIGTIVE